MEFPHVSYDEITDRYKVHKWDGGPGYYFTIDGWPPTETIHPSCEAAEASAVRHAELARVDELIDTALGRVENHYLSYPGSYDRATYERACEAIGLEPLDDDATADEGSSARSIAQYELKQRRDLGIEAERVRDDAQMLKQVIAVVGRQESYTREQYELACHTVGATAYSDPDCGLILENVRAEAVGYATAHEHLPKKGIAAHLAAVRYSRIEEATGFLENP